MKTNHYLTPQQIEVVTILLGKLNQTIDAKRGNDVYYDNIRVLGSDYTPDIFINFEKVVVRADVDVDKIYWQIKPDGTVNDDALHTMQFDTLSDGVHFFNTLFEIKVSA